MAIIAGICSRREWSRAVPVPRAAGTRNPAERANRVAREYAANRRSLAHGVYCPWLLASLAGVLLVAGCAGRRAVAVTAPQPVSPGSPAPSVIPGPVAPGAYVEQGVASWYGVPFQGRRAADGEIFDMHSMVAAHRTLPFGSIVRVTNLSNGLSTEVRIIDRGPFVGGRILDLAFAPARAIDMIGPGTAMVRIEVLSGPSPAGGDFTVQIGAFMELANAERLRERLLPRYQPIFIQQGDTASGRFYRVRVGRVANPDAAQKLARQLRESGGFQTFVLRLDSLSSADKK